MPTTISPEEVKSSAQMHLDDVKLIQDKLDAKQLHPAGHEGGAFQIIVNALEFILNLFHHSASEQVDIQANHPPKAGPAPVPDPENEQP